MRPGTENTAAIVGLGAAFEKICSDHEEKTRYVENLRNRFEKNLSENKRISVNGACEKRIPGISSITVKNADGERILLMLDLKGICASAGSACTSGSSSPSHVLKAMGLSNQDALSSIRFSFDENNTCEDIDYITENLINIIRKI